jgi:hypothetical protein
MWMTTKKPGAEGPDKERELREEFVCQSGIALERILGWMVSNVASERRWAGVPWWMKKVVYTLDTATLSSLKSKPPLEMLDQIEATVQRVISGCKELQGGPDLTALGVAMTRYMQFRRSG